MKIMVTSDDGKKVYRELITGDPGPDEVFSIHLKDPLRDCQITVTRPGEVK